MKRRPTIAQRRARRNKESAPGYKERKPETENRNQDLASKLARLSANMKSAALNAAHHAESVSNTINSMPAHLLDPRARNEMESALYDAAYLNGASHGFGIAHSLVQNPDLRSPEMDELIKRFVEI